MRIVVEDYSRNDIIAAQISNEVNCCMPGYFPAMPSHRTTDVQGKQNSVVFDHWLLLLDSLRLHGHVVHCVEVLIGVERAVEHSSVCPDSVEHLRDVRVGDVMVFSVDAGCHHEIPQRLSVLILDIYSKDDDFEVPNVHVLSKVAEQLVCFLVAGVAVGVVAISDENVHEEPVVSREILLKNSMQLHHQTISVEESVAHSSSAMRMDVPYFPWGRGARGLLEATGKQGSFGEEMGVRRVYTIGVAHIHEGDEVKDIRQLKLMSSLIEPSI